MGWSATGGPSEHGEVGFVFPVKKLQPLEVLVLFRDNGTNPALAADITGSWILDSIGFHPGGIWQTFLNDVRVGGWGSVEQKKFVGGVEWRATLVTISAK